MYIYVQVYLYMRPDVKPRSQTTSIRHSGALSPKDFSGLSSALVLLSGPDSTSGLRQDFEDDKVYQPSEKELIYTDVSSLPHFHSPLDICARSLTHILDGEPCE